MNRSKSVVLLTLGRGINAIVNILFLPYMARALDYADYATYGQVLLVVELAVILISVSSNQYLYVLLSNSKKFNKRDVLFNSVLLSFILSILLVVFLFFGTPFISSGFENLSVEGNLLIYSFCAFPMLLSSTFNYVLFFFDRVKHALLIQIIFNIFKVISIVLAVQFFKSLEMIFWFLLIINFAVLLFYVKRFPIKIFKGKFNRPIMSQFLKYGYTLGMTMVLGTLIKRTDGLMVSSILRPEDYALFRMGAIEIPFLMMVFSSVITITLPTITKLYKKNNIAEIIRLKRKATSSSVLAIYPTLIFVLVFAYPILTFYLGMKYYGSIIVFVLYNIVLFIRINDYRDILIAASKTRLIFTFDLFVFLLNIVLNYFMINAYGIEGAVIASLISFFMLSFLLHISTTKIIKIQVLKFFNVKLIVLTLILSGTFAGILFLAYNMVGSIFLIPLFYLIFIVTTYYLLFKLDDRIREILVTLKKSLKIGK